MPTMDEGDILLQLAKLPSISLERSAETDLAVQRALLEQAPEIKDIIARTGSDELGLDPMGLNETDSFLVLAPRQEWRQPDKEWLTGEIRKVMAGFAGMDIAFTQPIEMRVSEMLTRDARRPGDQDLRSGPRRAQRAGREDRRAAQDAARRPGRADREERGRAVLHGGGRPARPPGASASPSRRSPPACAPRSRASLSGWCSRATPHAPDDQGRRGHAQFAGTIRRHAACLAGWRQRAALRARAAQARRRPGQDRPRERQPHGGRAGQRQRTRPGRLRRGGEGQGGRRDQARRGRPSRLGRPVREPAARRQAPDAGGAGGAGADLPHPVPPPSARFAKRRWSL